MREFLTDSRVCPGSPRCLFTDSSAIVLCGAGCTHETRRLAEESENEKSVKCALFSFRAAAIATDSASNMELPLLSCLAPPPALMAYRCSSSDRGALEQRRTLLHARLARIREQVIALDQKQLDAAEYLCELMHGDAAAGQILENLERISTEQHSQLRSTLHEALDVIAACDACAPRPPGSLSRVLGAIAAVPGRCGSASSTPGDHGGMGNSPVEDGSAFSSPAFSSPSLLPGHAPQATTTSAFEPMPQPQAATSEAPLSNVPPPPSEGGARFRRNAPSRLVIMQPTAQANLLTPIRLATLDELSGAASLEEASAGVLTSQGVQPLSARSCVSTEASVHTSTSC